MAVRQHIAEVARMGRVAVDASVARPARAPAIARRAAQVLRRGFSAREARLFDLLDPSTDLGRYASRAEGYALQDRLNPESGRPLAEHKALFARFCEWRGVPAPRVLALHRADGPGWTADGRALAGHDEWLRHVREDLPAEFVIKPAWGHLGKGVRVLARAGAGFAEAGGGVLSAEDLLAVMAHDPHWPEWIIQERVRNHPDLRALSCTEAVQTVRAITLLHPGDTVRVLWADLRVVMGDAQVDNWRDGTTGNGLAPVDIPSGRLGAAVGPAPGGEGLRVHAVHPRSGRRFDEVLLPGWADAVELLQRVAPELAPMRALGWDVVLGPDGPLVLEVQARWGPHNQSVAMPGIMAAMATALGR